MLEFSGKIESKTKANFFMNVRLTLEMTQGKRYKPSRVKISSWSRATKTRQQFCHRGYTCHSNLWFVLLAHFDCLKTSLWHDFFFRGLSNWNLSNSTSSYGFSLASFLRINTNFCLDLLFTSRRRPALRWENGCWTSLRFTQISTSPWITAILISLTLT